MYFSFQISTNSYRPFRYPPSDACSRLKEALSAIDFFDRDDLADLEELRDLLTQSTLKALIQVIDKMKRIL